jgi:hypothetical protein
MAAAPVLRGSFSLPGPRNATIMARGLSDSVFIGAADGGVWETAAGKVHPIVCGSASLFFFFFFFGRPPGPALFWFFFFLMECSLTRVFFLKNNNGVALDLRCFGCGFFVCWNALAMGHYFAVGHCFAVGIVVCRVRREPRAARISMLSLESQLLRPHVLC